MTHKNGALAGIKVLDLSRILAGPSCTQILGDLGAEVIKIEKPETGDDTRSWGPPFFEGTSAYYLSANRNKKSCFLDLKSEGDREKVFAILENTDILVENFKPGDLQRIALDYESLASRFPRLIYCTITGFGLQGPYRDKPGYDALIQAMGGLMSITGPTQNQPTKVGVAMTDLTAGLYAAVGILSALNERSHSGKGQHLEISLFDCQVASLANVAMNYLVSGEVPQPLGNHHPSIVPYGTYPCADGEIMLAVGNDAQFSRLKKIVGNGLWENEKFNTNQGRVEHRAELEAPLNQIFASQSRAHWLGLLEAAGIPAGPINNMRDLETDPHQKARGLFRYMDDGKTPCLSNPIRLSRTPIKKYSPPGKN
ncbi:MAG: CoA transferase [Bdellovibrionaceae bacterium]|nr:CoA transferase [Bdellovibrionales bacterium]MCB9084437.1 CoA transferase [Pseudobdellovibrionaceae bacterium]